MAKDRLRHHDNTFFAGFFRLQKSHSSPGKSNSTTTVKRNARNIRHASQWIRTGHTRITFQHLPFIVKRKHVIRHFTHKTFATRHQDIPVQISKWCRIACILRQFLYPQKLSFPGIFYKFFFPARKIENTTLRIHPHFRRRTIPLRPFIQRADTAYKFPGLQVKCQTGIFATPHIHFIPSNHCHRPVAYQRRISRFQRDIGNWSKITGGFQLFLRRCDLFLQKNNLFLTGLLLPASP